MKQAGNGLGMSFGFSVINWVFTTQEQKKEEGERGKERKE